MVGANAATGSAGEYTWLPVVLVVLAVVARSWVRHRTEERREREREREYTRRVEAAVAGTESRHRAEVVAACRTFERPVPF
jgi:heme exporter protein D